MGWSFSCNPNHGRKEEIAKVTSASHFSPGYVPLEHRVVGSRVWTLLEHEGRRFIALDLIKGGGRGYGWGSKGLSEDMGPHYYDCPLSLLNKTSEPANEYAAKWREKVRSFHAERKARSAAKASLETGSLVRYGGHEYRLHSPAGPRRGWNVVRCGDGASFRMRANQVAQAEVVR